MYLEVHKVQVSGEAVHAPQISIHIGFGQVECAQLRGPLDGRHIPRRTRPLKQYIEYV